MVSPKSDTLQLILIDFSGVFPVFYGDHHTKSIRLKIAQDLSKDFLYFDKKLLMERKFIYTALVLMLSVSAQILKQNVFDKNLSFTLFLNYLHQLLN